MSAFLGAGGDSRVVPADILLVGIILLAIIRAIFTRRLAVSIIYVAAAPMLIIFLLGSLSAANPDRVILETIIVLFGLIGSLSIASLISDLPELWLLRFTRAYVLLIGALAAICLVDFLIMPGIVSNLQVGGLRGPFRNTGQAGSFFGVHTAIIVALLIAQVVPRTAIYLSAGTATVLALAFTLKRASLLAFGVGLIALLLFLLLSRSARERKASVVLLITSLPVSLIGYELFQWAITSVEGMRWRIEYKYSPDRVEDFSTGFLRENINSALSAFADSPFIGVGLNNVEGVYQPLEIHSTYLGILAYGGILGVMAYAFFMFVLLRFIFLESRHTEHNAWAAFLYALLPLLMGLMVGWTYTPHYRKREFWILVVFVVIAAKISKRLRRKATQQ